MNVDVTEPKALNTEEENKPSMLDADELRAIASKAREELRSKDSENKTAEYFTAEELEPYVQAIKQLAVESAQAGYNECVQSFKKEEKQLMLAVAEVVRARLKEGFMVGTHTGKCHLFIKWKDSYEA